MKNFKILQEKENQLFNRKEIQSSVEAETTPSHEDIKKLISEKFSTKIENIKIKKISGKFGSKTFTITANIYASEEDKDKTELKSKKDSKETPKEVQSNENIKENSTKDESLTDINQSEPTGETNSNQSSEPASEQSKE